MSTESRNPFGVTDDASVGAVAWTCANGDLDNDDGTESSVALGSSNQSHYLQAIQCGFTIPSDATINGVLVTVLRRVANGSGGFYPAIRDVQVRLAYIGAIYGDNKADTGTDWPVSELQADYGGISDLWGVPLTPAIINHTSFGVMISLNATGGVTPDTAYIDRVTIQVTYTVPDVQPSGGEYVEIDWPEEPAWIDAIASGIAGDEYNVPPTADAVTLAQACDSQFDEPESLGAPTYADAGSASMLDGLADVAISAAAQVLDEPDEQPSSGVELVGAAWLADGSICDCPGFALITAGGYGTAIVRGYGAGTGESQAFGTASIVGGYGTAKIITSCTC